MSSNKGSDPLKNSLSLLNEIKNQLNNKKTIDAKKINFSLNQQSQVSPFSSTVASKPKKLFVNDIEEQIQKELGQENQFAEQVKSLQNYEQLQWNSKSGIYTSKGSSNEKNYGEQPSKINPQQNKNSNNINYQKENYDDLIENLPSIKMAEQIRQSIKGEIKNFSRECDNLQQKIQQLMLKLDSNGQKNTIPASTSRNNQSKNSSYKKPTRDNECKNSSKQSSSQKGKLTQRTESLQKSIKGFNDKFDNIMKDIENKTFASSEKLKQSKNQIQTQTTQFKENSYLHNYNILDDQSYRNNTNKNKTELFHTQPQEQNQKSPYSNISSPESNKYQHQQQLIKQQIEYEKQQMQDLLENKQDRLRKNYEELEIQKQQEEEDQYDEEENNSQQNQYSAYRMQKQYQKRQEEVESDNDLKEDEDDDLQYSYHHNQQLSTQKQEDMEDNSNLHTFQQNQNYSSDSREQEEDED